MIAGATPAFANGDGRYSGWWLPGEAAGAATSVDERIDGLFIAITAVTAFFLLLVIVLLAVAIVRFRRRGDVPARYIRGNARLELLYAAVPTVVLVVLAVAGTSIWSQIKQEFPPESEAFVVEIRPRQFQWDVAYAGADRQFGTRDDITAINRLDVPAGRPVIVRLMAQDVIHSFFVPEFRVKQDAVPGMVTRTWFNVPRPGTFEIACAELCGLGHYRMRGVLTVHAPAEFSEWYAAKMHAAATLK